MIRIVPLVLFSTLFVPLAFSATPAQPPLRVGIVGLVHGHVHGFLAQSRHSPEIEIVGVAEPCRASKARMKWIGSAPARLARSPAHILGIRDRSRKSACWAMW